MISEQQTDYIRIVENIITLWKNEQLEDILALLEDDVEYHFLMGQRPLIGKEWVKKFLYKFRVGQTDINWEIVNHAQTGNKLLVEGIDDYVDADGAHIRTPYMGIFEFKNGRIHRWRDYLDPALVDAAKEAHRATG